jgi:predicted metal-dependent peptidase
MKNLPPPKPRKGGGEPVSGFDPGHPDIPQSWKDMWMDVKQVQGTPEEIAKAEQKMQQEVEHALANARAAGNVPKGIELPMQANRRTAEEPWQNHLHRYMQSLRANAYNWNRFARRQLVCHRVFAPNNISEALGATGIFVDASGSVYTRQQQAGFAAQINAILSECKPSKVYVYYFDTIVHKHIEMDPGEIEFDPQPQGGGGTSFEYLWDYAEEQGHVLDLAIVLTDLEGTFPREQPPYPVVWASIERHPVPFGEAVYLN